MIMKKSPDVEKYLTELKEFPTESPAVSANMEKKHTHNVKPKGEAVIEEIETAVDNKENGGIVTPKLIILGIINLVFVITLAFILGNLPQKTVQLKALKSQILKAQNTQGSRLLMLDIENNRQKSQFLDELLPDERGLINFVRDIDRIKTQGVIVSFSFGGKEPVVDKTGFLGIPIIITLRGSGDEIASALDQIQELPYLIRAVKIDSDYQESEDVINFKYGGFLYVDEEFGQN